MKEAYSLLHYDGLKELEELILPKRFDGNELQAAIHSKKNQGEVFFTGTDSIDDVTFYVVTEQNKTIIIKSNIIDVCGVKTTNPVMTAIGEEGIPPELNNTNKSSSKVFTWTITIPTFHVLKYNYDYLMYEGDQRKIKIYSRSTTYSTFDYYVNPEKPGRILGLSKKSSPVPCQPWYKYDKTNWKKEVPSFNK